MVQSIRGAFGSPALPPCASALRPNRGLQQAGSRLHHQQVVVGVGQLLAARPLMRYPENTRHLPGGVRGKPRATISRSVNLPSGTCDNTPWRSGVEAEVVDSMWNPEWSSYAARRRAGS